jgi:hypothetical protein
MMPHALMGQNSKEILFSPPDRSPTCLSGERRDTHRLLALLYWCRSPLTASSPLATGTSHPWHLTFIACTRRCGRYLSGSALCVEKGGSIGWTWGDSRRAKTPRQTTQQAHDMGADRRGTGSNPVSWCPSTLPHSAAASSHSPTYRTPIGAPRLPNQLPRLTTMKTFAMFATTAALLSVAAEDACDNSLVKPYFHEIGDSMTACENATGINLQSGSVLSLTSEQQSEICSECADMVDLVYTFTWYDCEIAIDGADQVLSTYFETLVGTCENSTSSSSTSTVVTATPSTNSDTSTTTTSGSSSSSTPSTATTSGASSLVSSAALAATFVIVALSI